MSLTRLQPNSVNKTANFTFGNVTANYFIGDGSQLTGITGGTYSNTNVAAYLPTYTGNVSANYFIGDGSLLTGLTGGSYGNANVANYLPTYTGNVSANYFIGNGSTLTNITGSNVTGYVPNATNANSATTADTVTTNAQPNITSVGILTGLVVSGNITPTANLTYSLGNNTHRFNDLYLSGNTIFLGTQSLSADGNGISITGNLSGSGSELTGINGANVTGQVSNALIAGTVYTTAQPNITSVGTLSGLSVSGLITATGTGIKASNIQDSAGTVTLVTGYASQSGDVGVYGNITAGTSGSGNITATYFVGNGSQLTGITATPTGSNTELQFNNAGSLGASSKLTWNGTLLSTENLAVTNSSGDEGGEILLSKPVSNTTIAGTGVTVDIYQNKIRFFEQGGTARGAYIDITAAGAGVASNLLAGGSATTPGGSNTYVQFNDSGSFGGVADLTFNKATNTLSATNFTGTVTTAAQPNITSVGALSSLAVTGYANFTDTATFRSSQDVTISGTPSGTVNYDLYNGTLFDVSPTANWTANVANIPTTNNRSTVVVFIITQGSTAYVPNVFQISGSTQTVKWLNNTTPSGTSNKIDVISFSLIRSNSSTWTVLGQSATYG
jgi:hypothetical protein